VRGLQATALILTELRRLAAEATAPFQGKNMKTTLPQFTNRLLLHASAALFSVVFAQSTRAADTSRSDDTAAKTGSTMGSGRNAPFAVTTVSGEAWDRVGATNSTQIAQLTLTLAIDNSMPAAHVLDAALTNSRHLTRQRHQRSLAS